MASQVTRSIEGVELKFWVESAMDRRRVFTFFGEESYVQQMIAASHNKVFIDAGAAIGVTSPAVATVAKRVIAFEPDPTHFRALTANVALNPGLPIEVHKIALGKTQTQDILYTPATTAGRCPSMLPAPGLSALRVDVVPLSLFEHADILKVDVEGYENAVIAGLDYTPEILFLEIHPWAGTFNGVPNMRETARTKRGREWLTIWEKIPTEEGIPA